MQAACDAAGMAPGGATMMSPERGSNAPPSASALTCAWTVPTFVPGAALVLIVVPAGITIDARAVESSPTAADATIRVTVPEYETESLGDVYAARAALAASASTATAATEITARRTFLMRTLLIETGVGRDFRGCECRRGM